MAPALLVSVLLIAACGLVYELVAGALASYLLGDSVTQFSTVIGTYLFAMGIGSGLSRFVVRGVAARFVLIELMVGLVGGFSSSILFLAFGFTDSFRVVLYGVVLVIGVLVGLEIPLLMRILRDRFDFKDVVAHVLTFDYLGALGASLLFPLVLVPHLGLVRAALLFGLINAGVALWTTVLLKDMLGPRRSLQALSIAVMLALGAGWAMADRTLALGETTLVRRRCDPGEEHAVPAHRAHRVEGRPSAVPELASAVQLARRVPLSRSARASGTGGDAGGAARAGARRRRRPGAARGPSLLARRARHAGRSRSGDDAAVFDAP